VVFNDTVATVVLTLFISLHACLFNNAVRSSEYLMEYEGAISHSGFARMWKVVAAAKLEIVFPY
jgi:hypothetical protein